MSFKIRWCMILVENLAQLGLKGNEMVDRPDWDLRLGYLIHDVSRLRRMMFDRALAPLGITRSQWRVLAFISRKDGLPQTQLATELAVGKGGVSALIDRLESSACVIVPGPGVPSRFPTLGGRVHRSEPRPLISPLLCPRALPAPPLAPRSSGSPLGSIRGPSPPPAATLRSPPPASNPRTAPSLD